MSKKGKYVVCTFALERESRPDDPPLAAKTVVMPANKPDRYASLDELCAAVVPDLLALRRQHAVTHPDCELSMYAESDAKGRMTLYATLEEAVAAVGPAADEDVVILAE